MAIFDILFVPMGYLIRFAYSLTNNYLFAILLFAFVVEIFMFPLQIKQQKNQIAQAKLQPKVRAITKKYDGRTDQASMQKKQMEIQELYQKEKFNPASGCLPLLIQMPIILCLYNVITSPLRYISGFSTEVIEKLTDLIGKDNLGKNVQIGIIKHLQIEGNLEKYSAEITELQGNPVLPEFNLGPIDLSMEPNLDFTQFSWLLLIPILVFITSYFSAILIRRFTYQSPETAQAQNNLSMKIMNISMPLLSTWISFSVPAAVGCYWAFRSVVSVLERILVSKILPIPKMSEEEIRAIEKEYSSKNTKKKSERDPSLPPVRSLHRIDFDDEPLPPPVIDEEEDEPEVSAEETPVEKAPLKDNKKKK